MGTMEIIRHRAAIAGYVTDAESGENIPGAVIRITGDTIEIRAQADGFFYFLDLQPGQYTLDVSAPDRGSRYGRASVENVTVHDDAEGRPVFDVKANVALSPTSLAGKVTRSSDAQPIMNAVVRVLGSEIRTMTDNEGNYLLSPLQAGTPNIESSASGYVPAVQKATLIAGQKKIIDFSLDPG